MIGSNNLELFEMMAKRATNFEYFKRVTFDMHLIKNENANSAHGKVYAIRIQLHVCIEFVVLSNNQFNDFFQLHSWLYAKIRYPFSGVL